MSENVIIKLDVEYRVTYTKSIYVQLETLDYEMDTIDTNLPCLNQDEEGDPEWEVKSSEIVFTSIQTE